jgi:hypothetical protein
MDALLEPEEHLFSTMNASKEVYPSPTSLDA